MAVRGFDREGGFRHLVAQGVKRAELGRGKHLRAQEGAIDHRADAPGRIGIGVEEIVVDRRAEAELPRFRIEPQQMAAEGLALERPELADAVIVGYGGSSDCSLSCRL